MERYNDNELVYLARQGCEEALEILVLKYMTLIKHMVNQIVSHTMFNTASREDIFQALLITFYRKIDAYREDQNTMFASFMFVVLERRLNTYTRDYHRRRYVFEKEMISFDEPISNKNTKYAMLTEEVIADKRYEFQPEQQLFIREGMNVIYGIVNEEATNFEKEVFEKINQGYSPQDVANLLNCSIRSVRNAFYRVNRKIKVKKP